MNQDNIIKILLISQEYKPISAGGVTLIQELCSHLTQKNISIKILTPRLAGIKNHEKESDRIEIHRCQSFRRTKGNANIIELLLFAFLSIFPALQIIKKNNIDIILSIFLVPSGFSGAICKSIASIPHICYIGGSDLPGVNSKFDKFLSKIKFILKYILRSADDILVAEGLENEIHKIDSKLKYTSVKNGANINKIKKIEREFPERRVIKLLTIGRLIERKGFIFLIEAFSKLSQNIKEQLQLSIIGYGPLENRLHNMINDMQLGKYIKLIGEVPKYKLESYYRSADFYIFYSTAEGNSLAMVEALGYSLPIITSDVAGNRELFNNNGFLVPYGDSQKLANTLIKIPKINKNNYIEWAKQLQVGTKWGT